MKQFLMFFLVFTIFSPDAFAASGFFKKWKENRKTRSQERKQEKGQRNYLDKTPKDIFKKYCLCYVNSANPTSSQLDLAAACVNEVYDTAEKAKAKGTYIKENQMYRNDDDVNSAICSKKDVSRHERLFRGKVGDEVENNIASKVAEQIGPRKKISRDSFTQSLFTTLIDSDGSGTGADLGDISDAMLYGTDSFKLELGSSTQNTQSESGSGDSTNSTTNTSANDEINLDDLSYREIRKMLDGKMTKSEIKTCLKAYKKGKRDLPNATDEEAKKYLTDKGCKVDTLISGLNEATGGEFSDEILFGKSGATFSGNGKVVIPAYNESDATGGGSTSANGDVNLDDMSFRDLRKKLDGTMTKAEIKTCYKAYKKGKQELPKANAEESKKYLSEKGCKVDLLLAGLANGGAGGNLEILRFSSNEPTVIPAPGSGSEVSDADIDKADAFTRGDLKEFLKERQVSDDERRACFKAFRKGVKKNPKATIDEAYAYMEANKCPLQKIFEGTNDGGVCLAKAKVKPDIENPIFKDEYFYKRYKGACNLNAPVEDQDKIIGCYSEARKNISKSKDLFMECTKLAGLDSKYDFMSFGQALKNEFKVAGCEPYYTKIASAGGAEPATGNAELELQQCIIQRVGQEAAKAILAEFAKDGVYRLLKDECEKKWKDNEEKKKECLIKLKNTSNMIGAFSAIGLDTMSCIPPRSVRQNGDRPITDANDFCNYLDADGGGSSKYATPTAKNHCKDRVKSCNEFKAKADMFQICGMTVVNCTKAFVDSRNGQDLTYNESACSNEGIAKGLYNNDRPNPNPNYNTSLCIAGAAASGLKALTSAICANEKKYPTSEKKEECLKKLQFVNEIGTAGATTAKCMQQGPAPMSDAEQTALEAGVASGDKEAIAKSGRRDSQIAQRNSCLAQGLGNQAVDLITQQVCNAKKTQEEKETCFKKAGIVKIAGTAAFRLADCQKINKTPYSDVAGNTQATKDYQACMQNAVLDTAMATLTSELAADVACKKHKGDTEKFEDCKNKYKKTMTLVGTGVSVAQRMAHCAQIQDPAQKNSCLVTASLTAGASLVGQMGALACEKHKPDQAKVDACTKNYAAAGQVINLAAATNVVINEVAQCKGDQACLAAVLAKQLPGDAGVYASFAVQGWGLIRQKNTCKIPSKYLSKAGSLVKIAGDLTTHIVHKVQTDELKKKYADLVHDEKVQGSDLYSNIKGFVESNKKDRQAEQDQERQEQFATETLANEAQMRALAFQRQNEENTLQSSLWQRPFLYGSTALFAAHNTMAVFEAMAEASYDIASKNPQTAATAKAIAPWRPCVDTNGEQPPGEGNWGAAVGGGSASVQNQEYRHVNMASVNKGFSGLTNQQAFAYYEDNERFLQGELKSISLDEYNEIGKIGLEKSPMPLSESLLIAANYTFTLIPESKAVDFAVLETIGVNMVGGLFPGTGGFGGTNPVGYAQDIAFLFVKKGLDMACKPEKRNPETGVCEYTGKATIEFAAKKATQALLKQNEAKINKQMKTPAGRIVIGLWNAGKLVKLVVDNEKIITQQRDRVNYLKSQEAQFKALNTGFIIRPKLKDLMDFVVADAYAKISKDPNNLSVCLAKNGNVDFKCSCHKTGCYNVMPMNDKKFRSGLEAMNGKFGNTFAQGLNATNMLSNMVNQMFSGARGTEDVNVEQLKQTSEKLNAFNGKLMGAYSNLLVKRYGKPIDFNKHVSAVDKQMFASLHPDVQRSLANVKINELAPKIDLKNRSAEDIEAESKAIANDFKDEGDSTPVNGVATEAIVEKKPEEEVVEVAKADTQMNEAMTKSYSYDKNDINLDKELSLFKVISGRYHKKKEKLHKHD